MYDGMQAIMRDYVEQMGKAIGNDDWDDQRFLRLELRRVIKSLRDIERALDLLNGAGFTVCERKR